MFMIEDVNVFKSWILSLIKHTNYYEKMKGDCRLLDKFVENKMTQHLLGFMLAAHKIKQVTNQDEYNVYLQESLCHLTVLNLYTPFHFVPTIHDASKEGFNIFLSNIKDPIEQKTIQLMSEFISVNDVIPDKVWMDMTDNNRTNDDTTHFPFYGIDDEDANKKDSSELMQKTLTFTHPFSHISISKGLDCTVTKQDNQIKDTSRPTSFQPETEQSKRININRSSGKRKSFSKHFMYDDFMNNTNNNNDIVTAVHGNIEASSLITETITAVPQDNNNITTEEPKGNQATCIGNPPFPNSMTLEAVLFEKEEEEEKEEEQKNISIYAKRNVNGVSPESILSLPQRLPIHNFIIEERIEQTISNDFDFKSAVNDEEDTNKSIQQQHCFLPTLSTIEKEKTKSGSVRLPPLDTVKHTCISVNNHQVSEILDISKLELVEPMSRPHRLAQPNKLIRKLDFEVNKRTQNLEAINQQEKNNKVVDEDNNSDIIVLSGPPKRKRNRTNGPKYNSSTLPYDPCHPENARRLHLESILKKFKEDKDSLSPEEVEQLKTSIKKWVVFRGVKKKDPCLRGFAYTDIKINEMRRKVLKHYNICTRKQMIKTLKMELLANPKLAKWKHVQLELEEEAKKLKAEGKLLEVPKVPSRHSQNTFYPISSIYWKRSIK